MQLTNLMMPFRLFIDLGVHSLVLFGLGRYLCGVVFGTYMLNAGVNRARVHERAAHEGVARTLFNKFALAGKQAFVGIAFARNHQRVGRNLIASAQHHDVVAHQLVERQLDARTVAHDLGFGAGDDRKLVGGALRTDFLNDADNRVAHDHDHEQHVLVRTRNENEHRQNHVHQIEKRANVIAHDFLHRARFHAGIDVHIARGDARGNLVGGKPHQGSLLPFFMRTSSLAGRGIVF